MIIEISKFSVENWLVETPWAALHNRVAPASPIIVVLLLITKVVFNAYDLLDNNTIFPVSIAFLYAVVSLVFPSPIAPTSSGCIYISWLDRLVKSDIVYILPF